MSKFSELIVLGRKRKRFSQAELARLVNGKVASSYNQGSVSRWEKDSGLPDDQAIVLEIADLLEIKQDELTQAWRENRGPNAERVGNTPVEYFTELQDELSAYQDEDRTCELWFVGPDILPAFSTDLARTKWKENIDRGHHYHFLWVLDYLSGRTLELMGNALGDMNRKWGQDLFGSKKGKLHLHAFVFDTSENNFMASKREKFDALVETVENFGWVEAASEPLAAASPEDRARLQGFTQRWATVICYFPTDAKMDRPPFASASTECLRRQRSERAAELNFFWFTDELAVDLRDTILAIKNANQRFSPEASEKAAAPQISKRASQKTVGSAGLTR